MSETKKLEELLQSIVNSQSEMNKEIKNLKSAPSQSTEQPISSKKQHSHSSNVLFDCPECQKAYDADVIAKAKTDLLKAEHAAHLKLKEPVMCKNCGEIVEKEIEECPTCKGKEAQEIE